MGYSFPHVTATTVPVRVQCLPRGESGDHHPGSRDSGCRGVPVPRSGRRNPENRGTANAGRILGIVGTVLMAIGIFLVILLLVGVFTFGIFNVN